MPSEDQKSTGQVSGCTRSAPNTVTLLILSAGSGDYHPVYVELFRQSVLAHQEGLEGVIFVIKTYAIVREPREYPGETDVKEAAAILITGSRKSAHSTASVVDAEEWILKLIDFISWSRYVNTDIRIIGICFGHQLLAACLGGRCQTDVKCWEIGVSSVVLTDSGKALLRNPESESTDALRIHQFHGEQVTDLPPGFACLGSTPSCAIQGMVYPEDATSLAEARILTLQGHPEYSPRLSLAGLRRLAEAGALSDKEAEKYRAHATMPDDGVYIGALLLRFIAER